jgi:hypothetical protein
MIIRIARVSMPVWAFAILLIARPAIGDSSTPPNLSPDGQINPTKKSPFVQPKPQPSGLGKVTTGTKKFFTNVGDALSLKRSQSKKTTTTPSNPWFKPPKEEPKPSWFSQMFHKEEDKKPGNPGEWISQPRLQ